MLSFDVGIEHGFAGWIPSYASIKGLSLQNAAYTSSVYI